MLISVCCCSLRAQQTDALKINNADSLLAQVDSLFTSADSLSIFQMIDSLLQTASIGPSSQLAIRLGYNSNVASEGRTLGISKFGLSPGMSFYHKSGLYADASVYWSKEYDPDFYLAVLTAGYLWPVTRRWSLVAEYNRFQYINPSNSESIPYKNNAGVSNFIELKPLTFRLDYFLYFGEKTGHRIMPGVFVNLEKRNWHKINRILLYPSINVMFGTERVVQQVPNAQTYLGVLLLIRKGLPLFTEVHKTVFGVMNYSFSLPLSITLKKWNFLMAYTYNIPIALPGEDLGLTQSGYASASITRYITFK